MRFRFSLRSCLVLVLIFALLLSPFSMRAIRQKMIVDKVLAEGGVALYDKGTYLRSGSVLAHWLYPVKYIEVRPSKELPVEIQLQWVAELPDVDTLSIKPKRKGESGLTDAGAALITQRFTHLKLLKVEGATCSNRSLRQVRDSMSESRGWVHRPNGFGVQLGSKTWSLNRLVEDIRLAGK